MHKNRRPTKALAPRRNDAVKPCIELCEKGEMNMHANFPKQQTAAPSRLGWPMLVTLAGLSLVALPSRSFADESERTEDPESMYRRAILAMDARDYDTACPMLEQITLVLPDGLGAKFTLGECFEEQGRLANAYRTFVAVEKAALDKGQPERSKRAAERAGALLRDSGESRSSDRNRS